jgi:hypothetical protein
MIKRMKYWATRRRMINRFQLYKHNLSKITAIDHAFAFGNSDQTAFQKKAILTCCAGIWTEP